MIDNMSKLVKSLRIDNLINGSFKPSSSERRQPIYDPGAGEEIGFDPSLLRKKLRTPSVPQRPLMISGVRFLFPTGYSTSLG